MKITELIQPGRRKPLPAGADFDDIWLRVLTRYCSQIISIYRQAGRVLYRGMKTDIPWFRAASRLERRAKDSNQKISEVFDDLLVQSGMQALRKNSVFLTSDYDHAADFGKRYVIFPVDGFEYTYTNQKDIVLDKWRQIIPAAVMQRLNDAYVAAFNGDIKLKWGQDWITHDVRNGDDPELALERLKQISDDPWVKEIEAHDDLFDVNWFKASYAPRNRDLTYAIEYEYEVMMTGQYYALSAELYGSKIGYQIKRSV